MHYSLIALTTGAHANVKVRRSLRKQVHPGNANLQKQRDKRTKKFYTSPSCHPRTMMMLYRENLQQQKQKRRRWRHQCQRVFPCLVVLVVEFNSLHDEYSRHHHQRSALFLRTGTQTATAVKQYDNDKRLCIIDVPQISSTSGSL